MDNEQLMTELLESSNYNTLLDSTTEFVRTYIKKLVWDVLTHVDASIAIGDIELLTTYSSGLELSQEITGIPTAYSAIDGEIDTLTAFSEQYAHLGISEYDTLAREAILDFLNLHNGLFVSLLSRLNKYELGLAVPKQSGSFSLTSPVTGKITIIPITFSFGTVRFLLYELPLN
ncbi:MAG: hypothetical protein QM697_03530 [Lachnospiraceae bacterium]